MKTSKLWGTARVTSKDIHVVPLHDLEKHQKNRWCRCGPDCFTRYVDEFDNDLVEATESEIVLVLHKAYDARE